MPLLPLSSSSLVYGSDDAGASLHLDNADVNAAVAGAGKELHLAVSQQ
jgi:hypothetical protein